MNDMKEEGNSKNVVATLAHLNVVYKKNKEITSID